MATSGIARGSSSRRLSSDANAIAEQLFNQARDLAKANRWAEACPKFEASLRAGPVLGTRLNLATCYEHIGKLASAWGVYRESVELAKRAGDAKRGDYAQNQADALEPRLPKFTLSARRHGMVADAEVTSVSIACAGPAVSTPRPDSASCSGGRATPVHNECCDVAERR